MSVHWLDNNVGYDGDRIVGQLAIDYWVGREAFEKDLDAQLAHIREHALVHFERLRADR